MSEGFKIPPRTVSSGAPVDPAKFAELRAKMSRPGANSTSPPPSRSPTGTPLPARPSMSPAPEDSPVNDYTKQFPGLIFYPVARFNDMRRNEDMDLLSDRVRDWAATLWPDGTSRPDNVWSREGLFSDKERERKDRKLSQLVLGVLGRITPENYERMKIELTNLPIRQSTDEEVTEVVKQMYNKAVRPEDELYTELYARLMADLVQHTGVDGVGKTIRKAIIDKCQHQFEQPYVLGEDEVVDANGNPLPQDEIEFKRSTLKAKLRANIKFLGHLFLSGMVNEKVVNFVLYHLLFGREAPKKRKPEEYELEMFCDLLKKVVRNLSPKTHHEYIADYMKSLHVLQPKVSNRIRFMLADLHELYLNKWEERRRVNAMPQGPMKLDDFEKREADIRAREAQEFERAAHAHRTGLPTASPKQPVPRQEIPLPPKDAVHDVMDQYKADGVPKVLEDFFKPIPQKLRTSYLSTWLSRIAFAAKRTEERKKVGDVIESLESLKLVSASEGEKVVRDLATSIVVDAKYEDLPKIWTWWPEIVHSSGKVLNPNLHTFLLRALIRGGERATPVDEIVKMVIATLKSTDPNHEHRQLTGRFRPLPAVLMYANKLPDPNVAEEDVDESDEDTNDDDLLGQIVREAPDIDPELCVFDTLCDNIAPSKVTDYIKRSDQRTERIFAAKVVCAIFTYVRCDTTGRQIERLKEPLKELAKSHDDVIVAEAFLTWLELNRAPSDSCARFFGHLKQANIIKDSSIESAFNLLHKFDPSFNPLFLQAVAPWSPPRVPGSPASAAGGGKRR